MLEKIKKLRALACSHSLLFDASAENIQVDD